MNVAGVEIGAVPVAIGIAGMAGGGALLADSWV